MTVIALVELLQKKLEGRLVELKFTTTLKLEIFCSRSFLPHLWDWLGWTSPPSPLPSLNTKRKGSYSSQDVEGRGENAVFSAGSSPGHAQCASHPTRGVLAIDEVDRGNVQFNPSRRYPDLVWHRSGQRGRSMYVSYMISKGHGQAIGSVPRPSFSYIYRS